MNAKLIDAIMTAYGMTKREAEKFARRIDEDMKQELIKGFMQDARKSAYNDWGGLIIWIWVIADFTTQTLIYKNV